MNAALAKFNCPDIKDVDEMETFTWKIGGILQAIQPGLRDQFLAVVRDAAEPEDIVIGPNDDDPARRKYKAFEGSCYSAIKGKAADLCSKAGASTFVEMFRRLEKASGVQNEVVIDAEWDDAQSKKYNPAVETFDAWWTKKKDQVDKCTPTYVAADPAARNRTLNKFLATLLPTEYEEKMHQVAERGRDHPCELNAETIRKWIAIKARSTMKHTEVQGAALLADIPSSSSAVTPGVFTPDGTLSAKGKQQVKSMMQNTLSAFFGGADSRYPGPDQERGWTPGYEGNGRGGKGGKNRKRKGKDVDLRPNAKHAAKKRKLNHPDKWCGHCKTSGHTRDECWALHPDKAPKWLERKIRKGGGKS